jgi:hypothetical protein
MSCDADSFLCKTSTRCLRYANANVYANPTLFSYVCPIVFLSTVPASFALPVCERVPTCHSIMTVPTITSLPVTSRQLVRTKDDNVCDPTYRTPSAMRTYESSTRARTFIRVHWRVIFGSNLRSDSLLVVNPSFDSF